MSFQSYMYLELLSLKVEESIDIGAFTKFHNEAVSLGAEKITYRPGNHHSYTSNELIAWKRESEEEKKAKRIAELEANIARLKAN